jgi:hypothetical protein
MLKELTRKRNHLLSFSALVLALAALACNPPVSPTLQPTATPAPVEPGVTPTQTEAPEPTTTPLPESTVLPTETPLPTEAPEPTNTPEPAPSSTPAPSPTPTLPPADFRGIVPNAYTVVDAPGPFDANEEIWFSFDVTNGSGHVIGYNALGTWVEETGQFQKSWSYSTLQPGENLPWDDHIHIPEPGTYNLWLAIEFSDGTGVQLMGPVTVSVQ